MASAPAGVGSRILAFQPGIRINWARRQVEVEATVILREGGLELFACSPDIREHESIVRIEARPLFVFQALGLIGLTEGHPVRYDPETDRVEPARGDPVEIEVRYRVGRSVRTGPIERWMKPSGSDRPLDRLPWIFTGSVLLEDGSIAADYEGTVVAVVDFSSSLIALSERHSDRNEELWLEPHTAAIPPVGTKCTLLLRPGPLEVTLDATGRVRLAGRRMTRGALAGELEQAIHRRPRQRFRIIIDPRCPQSDVQMLRSLLDEMGLAPEAVSIRQIGPMER